MIFQNGPVSELNGTDWFALELSNEHTLEATIRRVAAALPSTFRDRPAEIFVPVGRRDLDVFDLKTGVYIFIRGDPKLVKRLCKVVGVIGFVGREMNLYRGEDKFHVIPSLVADAEVRTMIASCLAEFEARGATIRVGSFVRVLDGVHRDYCGTVEETANGEAVVKIEFLTLLMFVETPTANLLPLDVPPEKRVFFYCPDVAELTDAEPLRREPNEILEVDELPEPDPPAKPRGYAGFSREAMLSSVVRESVNRGVADLVEIARVVMGRIRDGTMRRPSNLLQASITIKKIVREVTGLRRKLSPEMMLAIDPDSGIPLYQLHPAQDGRCRAAREAKKERLRHLQPPPTAPQN